ncbi:MAG: DNA polymerase III subunit alpha, partial [Saprospiraceae bacterium]
GAADIPSLFKKAKLDGMPALAITDHGNMFGVFSFVAEANKHKLNPDDPNDKRLAVKPIVGCEFYVVENRHKRQFTRDERDKRYHQVMLAKNDLGYRNLSKLCSLGFIEGMYGKYPRIDKELIEQYHEGLIATTCCLGAEVPQAIMKQSEAEAEKVFKWWLDIFGEDYYIELQRHGIQAQDKVNEVLLRWATKYNVKVIATNDSHYVEQENYNAHDILLCINTGEKQSTPSVKDFDDDNPKPKNTRFAFYNDQFFFKTQEQMKHLFHDVPQAIDYTNEIVGKIDTLDLVRDILLPHFTVPLEFGSQDQYLKHLTYEGAKSRYTDLTPEVEERINFELGVIQTMGFAGYFLIVADFIRAGRDMGVFVGPGRGSAAGSAVAYCIGITNIDPIKYKLLFERFLNPERKSMPDIDTDFDDEGRQKVIDYVVDKYGKKQVAQIITYGTMAARTSIQDVARVLDLPLPDMNELKKLIPEKLGFTLKKAFQVPIDGEDGLRKTEDLDNEQIENIKKLREIAAGTDIKAQVLKEAQVLEGSVRNTGVHAAGIIIAPSDLTDLIPVCVAKDSDLLLTQFEGNVIENVGVLKMDFLGLKTLSILKNALVMIKTNHGIELDLDHLDLENEASYKLFQKGDTNGIFQFESAGMQKYLKDLKPDKFEDLIAMCALFRPGPLKYIPDFIARKHGRQKINYDLAEMEEYLEETYGITVYQEQVMLLSQSLAGFSKGDADVLRKAMGKKQKSVLDKMKAKFIDGATAKGLDVVPLEKIWSDWENFAQYAFNKSHATCYAMVAYQTAYLKANYPAEFMAAVLNNASNIDKITFFMSECKKMGVDVLGPDVNESESGFTVNSSNQIRFGLGALKGVGEGPVGELKKAREEGGPFVSVYDMMRRVNLRSVNKKSLESMIQSGALDCFTQIHRAQYFRPSDKYETFIEHLIRYGNQHQASGTEIQNSLFGGTSLPAIDEPQAPASEVLPLNIKLNMEKEVAGFFLSGHPLDDYYQEMKLLFPININRMTELKEIPVRLAVFISNAKHQVNQKGNGYGVFQIEDYSGSIEIRLFTEDYRKFQHLLVVGAVLYVEGNYTKRYNSDEMEFKVKQVNLLEPALEKLIHSLTIQIPVDLIQPKTIEQLAGVLKTHKGNTNCKMVVFDPIDKVIVNFKPEKFKIRVNSSILAQFESMGFGLKLN